MIELATGILRERHEVSGPAEIQQTWGASIVIAVDDLLIKANGDRSTTAEAFVAGTVRDAGVPAPEIIDSGLDNRLPGGRWIIMKRIPGRSWDASAADPAQIAAVIDDVVRYLITLCGVTRPGWGWIDDDGHGTARSWSDWLHSQVADCAGVLGSRLSPDFVGDADVAIDTTAPDLLQGSILNGDLGLGHVFVESSGRTVTGILDWAAAIIGDPLYDVATFAMGGPAGDPIQEILQPRLIRTYEHETGQLVDRRRVDLYRMINHLFNACWSVQNDVPTWTTDLCAAAQGLLTKINN